MITTRGMNTSGFTFPPGMKSRPRSVSNNPNYNPSRFGQGIKTDGFGRTAAQRFGDYLRGEQLDYRREQQEKIKRMTSNPLQSMYTSSGGRNSRPINQSMIGGMPAEEYKKTIRRAPTYAERRAADPEKYRARALSGPSDALPFGAMDSVSRAQQKAFDELPSDDPRKQQFKMVDGRLFYNNDNRYNPFLETPMTPTFNKPKQLTERQIFNLGAFSQAKPGTRFANNSGYNVVFSNSLLGKTAGMQPPVNLSFIGSEY